MAGIRNFQSTNLNAKNQLFDQEAFMNGMLTMEHSENMQHEQTIDKLRDKLSKIQMKYKQMKIDNKDMKEQLHKLHLNEYKTQLHDELIICEREMLAYENEELVKRI